MYKLFCIVQIFTIKLKNDLKKKIEEKSNCKHLFKKTGMTYSIAMVVLNY